MTTSYDLSQAVNRYRKARLRNYRPPKRLNRWEWAEENIVLTERTSPPFPGRYRTSVAPYVRGPLEAMDDHTIKGIVCPWCAQSGKTLNLQIIPTAFDIDQDPGPELFVLPNETMARSFSESRLQPVFDENPVIARHKPKDPDRYKLLEMHFERMVLNLVGSNSPANLAQRPIRYLRADEVDKFPPASQREADALSLALERMKAFWNAIVCMTSTPTHPEGNIWKYWRYSDQRKYFVPCPHCGEMQILCMEENDEPRLHWPKDCLIRELDNRAWIECVKCNKKITDRDKPAMLQVGEWRPTADLVQWSGDWIGFHLSAFYPLWVKFGEIAAEFLRSKRYPDTFQNFKNSWEALPFDPVQLGTDTIDAAVVLKSRGGYKKNIVPPKVIFLTTGIDVQAHEVWFVVRGWGREDFSALISWGKITVETDDLKAFNEAVRSVILAKYERPILLTGIDSGWGKRTGEVYSIARQNQRVICTKGRRSNVTRSTLGSDVPLPRPKRIDKYPDGKPIPGGVLLYSPSTMYWKRYYFARVNAEPPSWVYPDGIIDDKEGKIYIRHIESEREVTKKNPKTGRYENEFVVRRGYDDNHLLDCDIQATIAAHVIMTAYDLENLEKLILEHPERLEIQEKPLAAPIEDDRPKPDPRAIKKIDL